VSTGVTLILLLFVFALYSPAFQNGFVNWDDGSALVDNPEVRTLSVENIHAIFSSTRGSLYKPLVTLSYALEYQAVGLKPFLYHLTNVLLHVVNTWLVFLLFRALGFGAASVVVTVLLFGIHPMQAETVAWISQRKNLLFALFYLTGLRSYVAYLDDGRKRWYFLTFLFFICSGLSKAVAVTFPIALCLIDDWRGRLRTKEFYAEKIPFFLVAALLVGVGIRAGAVRDNAPNVLENVQIASYALLFYFGKIFYPIALSPLYPYPEKIQGALPWAYVLSPWVVTVGIALAIYSRRFTKKIFFGVAWFLVLIVPNIQLLPSIGEVIVADRYVYLPSLGIFFLLGETFRRGWRRKRIFGAAALVGLAVLSAFTWKQCQVWKTNATLWNHVLLNNARSETAYFNLGNASLEKGDVEPALIFFKKALEIKPKDSDVWLNLGNAYDLQGKSDEALRAYRQALLVNPKSASAYQNIGVYYEKKGNRVKAVEAYHHALELDPNLWEAHMALAEFDISKRNWAEALNHLETAKKRRTTAELHSRLGMLYGLAGHHKLAVYELSLALKQDPQSLTISKNLGVALILSGDKNKAKQVFKKAIQSNPGDAELSEWLKKMG